MFRFYAWPTGADTVPKGNKKTIIPLKLFNVSFSVTVYWCYTFMISQSSNGIGSSEHVYACLWSYLSPTLSVWAWFSVWRWVFRSKPASGAGTRTWALFGDTVLTAVQASPSSFHKQDRSGRSSTALMSTEIWKDTSMKLEKQFVWYCNVMNHSFISF